MRKLKGVLKIYSKQDLSTIFFILGIELVIFIFNSFDTISGRVFHSNIAEYFNYLVFFIVFDCTSSFSIRYIMCSNFNNCRKFFYKSQLMLLFLKSVAGTVIVSILIGGEISLCRIKNYDYSIKVLGNEIVNIQAVEMLKLLILVFVVTSLFWTISFVFSTIEKLGITITFGLVILMTILKEVFFGTFRSFQSSNYLGIIFLCVLVGGINLIVAWFIINKKSQLGDSWFIRLSKSYYGNDQQ